MVKLQIRWTLTTVALPSKAVCWTRRAIFCSRRHALARRGSGIGSKRRQPKPQLSSIEFHF